MYRDSILKRWIDAEACRAEDIRSRGTRLLCLGWALGAGPPNNDAIISEVVDLEAEDGEAGGGIETTNVQYPRIKSDHPSGSGNAA